MTAYLDGRKAASAATNHPLAGKNQDIYIGVNNWDRTFDGLVDEVKVYAADMTEDQVQNQDREYFEQMLTSWMNDTLALKPRKILGENKSVNEIKYDLKLPSEVDGLPIIWSSSDESIIKPDGTVANPEQKTTVTLTATVNAGMLSASREYQLTVLGLDRTGLNELIAKAESIRTEKLAEVSRARLEQALKEAKEADGYSSIRTAYAHLQQAVEELCYLEDYRNPFPSVVAPELYAAVKEDVGVQLFTLPASIKDAVEVTYVSEKPELVSYTDGEIRGLKPGKAVVTVIVTSQYDQWQMEYSTAVTIEEKTEAPGGNPSTGDSSGTNNSGNSGNTGGTGSSGGSGKSSSSHRGSSDDAAPAAAPAAVAAGQGAAVTTAVRGSVGEQLTGGNAGVQGETGETADGTPAETLTPDDGELQKNEETPPEIRDILFPHCEEKQRRTGRKLRLDFRGVCGIVNIKSFVPCGTKLFKNGLDQGGRYEEEMDCRSGVLSGFSGRRMQRCCTWHCRFRSVRRRTGRQPGAYCDRIFSDRFRIRLPNSQYRIL